MGSYVPTRLWNASIKAGKSDAELHPEWSAARDESQPDVKLLFDRNKGVLDAHDRVFINKYHYSEPIPQQQWTMAEGDSTILGYTCHKANDPLPWARLRRLVHRGDPLPLRAL